MKNKRSSKKPACASSCNCIRCIAEDNNLCVTNNMLDIAHAVQKQTQDSQTVTSIAKKVEIRNEELTEMSENVKENLKENNKLLNELQISQLENEMELMKLRNLVRKKGNVNHNEFFNLTLEKNSAVAELRLAKQEIQDLEEQVKKGIRERMHLNEIWKSSLEEIMIEHQKEVIRMKDEIRLLKRQNEGYKASAKQASEVLEQDISKMSALESELKLKNDQKRDLIHQKRAFEAQIRTLDAELKEFKVDECPICFEETSIERKWTAFLPCGHRTCSDCADKISALPRNTNRRKCPNCRENINCFLVLEGIYEG